MPFFNRLTAVMLSVVLIGPVMPLPARTRKGDTQLALGRAFEQKKDWDNALDSYRKALAEDPSDIQYQMAAQKARFQSSQAHVENGVKIRKQGLLGDAMIEFQRAFSIDPGSTIAVQEIRTTQDMIERERLLVMQTGKESSAEDRALTPLQQIQRQTDDRLERILPVPELRPLGPKRFDLTIRSNIPKTLFETLGGFAGINVLWDSDQAAISPLTQPIRNVSVNFQNSTLDEALDYLAVLTKAYWKPLSANTIFVTVDSRAKRLDYADQVMKVFYLSNVQTTQEIQEIVNAVRTVCDIQRMFAFNGQNAIVARDDADKIALAEKIIHDLDRPKAEVVVDIVVMETSSNYSRQLAAALAPTGLNVPANFTPRNGLKVVTDATAAASSSDTTATTTTTTTTGTSLPLSNLGHLASSDWSTTLPSALLQAVMSDADTKVLQAPQLRSMDNMKASLKIGNKQPTASGGFGSALGVSGAGISPMFNTQFQYLDVGVNVEITPRVHDNGDISLHLDLDISSTNGSVDLGGISQPIISQKKVLNDIRLREGEVNLLGGLINVQDTKTVTGIPGLSRIPLLRRLFTGESIVHQHNELMIALVPHIVRRPVFTAENLRTIDVGTANAIHLNYASKPDDVASPPAGQAILDAPSVLTPTPERVAAPPPAVPAAGPAPAQSPVAFPPAPGAPPGLVLQQLTRPMPGGMPGLPPGTPPDASAPAGNASSHFEPARFETSANGNFSAALILDSGADAVSASPLQIRFDPALLRVMDISPGDLFSRDGAQPIFARDIQNEQGLATVQLSRQPGAAGVDAPGTLIIVRFQAIAPGETTVGVLNLTVRNSQALAIGSSHPQLSVSIK